MIDFKYHVVSLISVFLAVALGIVIGTTALNGGIVENLSGQVSTLKDGKRVLENRVDSLQTQAQSNSDFDASVAKQLVADTLTGQTFITFTVGDGVTSDDRDAVITMLQDAGAKNTGAIALTDSYSDPKKANNLFNFVTDNQPPGVTLTESATPGEAVGSLLAALLVDGPAGTPVPETEITKVLAGLSSLGALKVDSDTATPATSFVIITRGAQTDSASDRNKILLALVAALDKAGAATVIAGDPESNTGDGLVGSTRANSALAATVTTVDNTDFAQGQISVAWGLAQELSGSSGAYGIGPDTKPAPPQPKPVAAG